MWYLADESERIKQKVDKDSKRTFLEKIIRYIPLYHGYKSKELRREADKILRENLYAHLKNSLDKLKDTRDRIVEAGLQELWSPIENLIARFDTVSQRVLYSDYGYSGFFNATKINERELDRMYSFDASLIEDVDIIRDVVGDLIDESYEPSVSKLRTLIRRVEDTVSQFEDKFSKREEYMNGFID